MIEELLESALLPILESAFRNGSILEISKEAETYHSYLGKFIPHIMIIVRIDSGTLQATELVAMPN